MNVAVLTLCRDRLEYTRHCFASLREFAGCSYDHFILDQGSTDGTWDWLWEDCGGLRFKTDGNMGISRGMNALLREVARVEEITGKAYDVIVKFDNDCELTQPNTLRDVAQLALDGNALLSPRILGLQNPPASIGEFTIGDETIVDIPQIGGIFLAAPAWVYNEFRYGEHNPAWGGDDVEICHWFRGKGGRCGYVKRLEAWHYETTDGQHKRYPDYFKRTQSEGKRITLAGAS